MRKLRPIDWTGKKPKEFKSSKKLRNRWYDDCLKYPYDFSVTATCGKAMSKRKEANIAIREIEAKVSKFGKWIGHGALVGGGCGFDTQVCFKTKKDLEKARKIAIDTLYKYGISGRYRTHIHTKKECQEIHGAKE